MTDEITGTGDLQVPGPEVEAGIRPDVPGEVDDHVEVEKSPENTPAVEQPEDEGDDGDDEGGES